jgi:hypothetical protein
MEHGRLNSILSSYSIPGIDSPTPHNPSKIIGWELSIPGSDNFHKEMMDAFREELEASPCKLTKAKIQPLKGSSRSEPIFNV